MIVNIIQVGAVRQAVVFTGKANVALILTEVNQTWTAAYGVDPTNNRTHAMPLSFVPSDEVLTAVAEADR